MDDDILQEIPDADLPLLRNLYKDYEKQAPQVYSLLDLSISWKKKKPDSNYLTFYGVKNDWLKSGTFIMLMQYSCHDLFLFTLEENADILYMALSQTKKIDWTKRTMFYSVASQHTSAVIKAFKELRLPSYECVYTEVWVIEKEKALKFEIECPDDVYIGPLKVSHAELINKHWPHGHEGTVGYLATIIEMNKSFGIFLKADDSLVCWILQSPMGQLKALQTLPEHKRKGYAVLVTKLLAREIAKDGHNPLGTIVRRNEASENMFRKLGFCSTDVSSYLIVNALYTTLKRHSTYSRILEETVKIYGLRTNSKENEDSTIQLDNDSNMMRIPDGDLQLLVDLYSKHESDARFVFSTLSTSTAWKRKSTDSNLFQFFGVNNDWLKSGTFVILFEYGSNALFVFTLEENYEIIRKALTETKLIDWSKRTYWYTVVQKHLPTVTNIVKELKPSSFEYLAGSFWMIEKEKALKFEIEIPDDVYVKSLDKSYAEFINTHWPYCHEYSEKFLATLIEMDASYGLFLKSNDTLVCWILTCFMGLLANLHTQPEHRKKGYALLLVKIMAKQVAQTGYDAQVVIMEGNIASEKMFEKIGFHKYDDCVYVDCIP